MDHISLIEAVGFFTLVFAGLCLAVIAGVGVWIVQHYFRLGLQCEAKHQIQVTTIESIPATRELMTPEEINKAIKEIEKDEKRKPDLAGRSRA